MGRAGVGAYPNGAGYCTNGRFFSCANAPSRRTHMYCPFRTPGHERVIAWNTPITIQMRLTILNDRLSFDLRVTRLIYKLFITVSSFFPGLIDINKKFDAVFKRAHFNESTERPNTGRRRIVCTRQACNTGGDNARQGPAVDASSKQS